MKAMHQKVLGNNERELILVFWSIGQALYYKRQLIKLLTPVAEREQDDDERQEKGKPF